MKKKLFGSLGQSIKTNWVIVLLSLCVVGAGALSFYTVSDINEKLKNQQLPQPDSVLQEKENEEPLQQQQAEEVQKPQQNVPLKPSAPPQNAEAATKPLPQPTATPEGETESRKAFVLPVEGKIFSAFSGNELVYNKTMDDWRTHNGIDIKAPKGTVVQACCDGTVTAVYQDGMLGYVVETDNGSYTVRYCGLGSSLSVQKGDKIKQKQPIGKVGEIPLEMGEESHIHLEVLKDGQYKNPDSYLE